MDCLVSCKSKPRKGWNRWGVYREHSAWVKLYIKRWLKAKVIMPDGQRVATMRGTPQGGVISPLLANLFLHYAHDKWIA